MKKLFQINSTLNSGSTGRIAENMGLLALQNKWESYIAYGRDIRETKSNPIRIGNKFDVWNHVLQSRLFDNHAFSSTKATKKLIKNIEDINPDVFLLHNLHGYYIDIQTLFNYLKKKNKPVFWTLYDCWAFTGHCTYYDIVNCDKWKKECNKCPNKLEYPKSIGVDNSKRNFNKKKQLYKGFKDLTLITNSNWLKGEVEQSILSSYDVKMIHNGINLSDFKPILNNKRRKELKLDNKFIILGIANIWDRRKGLEDFLKLSSLLDKDEVIVLDGLTEKQRLKLPQNIIALDRAKSINELVALYSMADVFLNPTWEDNFPTTNLEALACGTPVITYKSGGSPEAINEETGFVVEKGNIEGLFLKIKKVKANTSQKYFEPCVKRAEKEFDYQKNYNQIFQLFINKLN